MKHAGSVCLVAMALSIGRPAAALDFALVQSFSTDFITASPLRSLSVSPREDWFLMAFKDGAIFLVSRDLETVMRILPGAVPPQESTWVGYHGLILISEQNRFIEFPVGPTGVFVLRTLAGQ